MIRQDADVAITTSRWCDILGIPRPTWYRWKAAAEAGNPAGKGPWPTPVQDAIEADVVDAAKRFDAWGHRKVWGVLRLEDVHTSQSSVKRVMGRNGLLQPVGYHAERRQLTKARKAAFVDPPTRRNRVWQMDFSELESLTGGIWRLGGVADYWAKVSLACITSTTMRTAEAIAMLTAAREQAQAWLGHPLVEEVVDPATGEIAAQIIIVTDNGPAFRSVGFARWIHAQPEFTHVRTRHRAPHTNGVIERTFQSYKYEHLYRREITDGVQLAAEVDAYRSVFNTRRPHEHLHFNTPISVYLQPPARESHNRPEPTT